MISYLSDENVQPERESKCVAKWGVDGRVRLTVEGIKATMKVDTTVETRKLSAPFTLAFLSIFKRIRTL
eukprot:2021732-Rhodomonas_salina.1